MSWIVLSELIVVKGSVTGKVDSSHLYYLKCESSIPPEMLIARVRGSCIIPSNLHSSICQLL